MTDSITKLLLQLGIRSTYYGFRYLRTPWSSVCRMSIISHPFTRRCIQK